MDDWPPDEGIIEDDDWTSPDDLPESQARQDPFSAAVGDAWESGRRATVLDEML